MLSKRLLFPLFATGTSAEALKTVLAAHNNTLSILNNFLSGQEALFAVEDVVFEKGGHHAVF